MASAAATLSILVEANTTKAAQSLRGINSQLSKTSKAATAAVASTSKYGTAATRASAATGKLGANASKMGATVSRTSRITQQAATHTASLERSTKKLDSSLKSAAKAAAGLVAGYVGFSQLQGAITDTLDLGAATDKLRVFTGLSTKAASEWIEVAKQRKVMSVALSSGFITLQKNIKAATEATGTQRDLFKELGISMEDLKRKNFQQTLLEIGDRIKEMGPGFNRANAVAKLFGRSAQTLGPILALGSKGIKEQLALVDQYGASLDKNEIKKVRLAAQAQRELGLRFDALKKKISLALYDAGVSIKHFIDKHAALKVSLMDVIHATTGWIKKNAVLNVSLLDLLGKVGKVWRGIKSTVGNSIEAVLGKMQGWSRGTFNMGKSIISVFVSIGSAIRSVAQWIVNAVQKMVGAFGTLKDKVPHIDFPSVPNPADLIPHPHFQRGGPINLGKASGDSVPALLEKGEYVLNRKAVRKMGKRNLDAVNFDAAPRFAKGGGIPAINVGGSGAPRAIVQGAADVMREAANAFIKKMQPSGPGGTKGPKGIGSYAGMPMANWVIESLKYAASKGVAPTPTSGYRSHAYNVSQGRNYFSEHEGTQYPHGAVDFGGYNTGLAAKMSVVGATAGFKYPLLAPIGFHDDGHASGTGHRLGGLIRKMRAGGWVHGSSSLNANQLATLAHLAGMPHPGLMSQIAQAESGGNPLARGGAGEYGLWQIMPFWGGGSSLLDPLNNARKARHILSVQGLDAWSTFNDGSYRGYPKGKVSPLGGAGGGGGGGTKIKPKIGLSGHAFSLPGGTLPIKGSTQTLGGAGVATLPGLGPTALPAGGGGLPAWAQKLLKTPGITYEGKLGVLESALGAAEATPGTGDDLAALMVKLGLLKGNKARLSRKLAAIGRKLRQKGLTPKQRAALLAQQATVLSNLGSTTGEIQSTQSAIAGLGEEALSEETGQALNEQLERMNELLKQQVANQTMLYQVSQSQYGVLAQAIAAVASGQIGGTTGLGFSAPSTAGVLASY